MSRVAAPLILWSAACMADAAEGLGDGDIIIPRLAIRAERSVQRPTRSSFSHIGIEIGARQKLRDFGLSDAVVKAKMRERHGGRMPVDELVISPVAMFGSTLLKTVQGTDLEERDAVVLRAGTLRIVGHECGGAQAGEVRAAGRLRRPQVG